MSASPAITLYGIPNCDSVKKARAWLADQGIPYRFHDFKKDGLTHAQASEWVHEVGIATLINRRGTTWRMLAKTEQARADDERGAIVLMVKLPSIIKRPVVEIAADGSASGAPETIVGFDAEVYADLFAAAKS